MVDDRGRKRGKKETQKKEAKLYEKKEKEKMYNTTISVTCLLHIPVIDLSLGGGIWRVDDGSLTMDLWALVLMGSGNGIL